LALEGNRSSAKFKLFARVRALSLKGDVLVDVTKEFFVKPAGENGRRVVEVGNPTPYIVDIVAHTYVQTPRLSCRALINLPLDRFMNDGVTVQCSLMKADGAIEQVFSRKLSAPRTVTWVRQETGVSQRAIEFDCALGETPTNGLKVQVKILSAYDEVLSVAQQSVQVAGVLVGAALGSGGEPTEEDSVSNGLNEFAAESADGAAAPQRRIGWLRRLLDRNT
jgi:hypothetical protein